MICCIPFCQKDVDQAIELLQWIRTLGSCKEHSCLLVADSNTHWFKSSQATELASNIFRDAKLITTEHTYGHWKEGANSLFLCAAQHIEEELKSPWLWLEPDAIPLKARWLDTLETVYLQAQKPFMGFIYEFEHPEPPVAPFQLMSGVAVYPADAWSRLIRAVKYAPNLAFDVSCAELTVSEGAHTNLIQHFYGQVGLPPTFVPVQTSETAKNSYGLDRIHPQAVVFHRCKDGSLIRLMSMKLLPNKFIVTFPFCNRDGRLLIKNLRWMSHLGHYPNEVAMLAYDHSCRQDIVNEVDQEARNVFGTVIPFVHAPPKNTNPPYGANHVFRCVSAYINGVVKRPFLWFEPDMVPVRKGWLETLQVEYARCGKPFLGSVVPGMGHFNGTAIYPADTFVRCPNARSDDNAFDMLIKQDVGVDDIQDSAHLIQCAWTMDRGQLQPNGGGQLPRFDSRDDVNRMILPTALLFHRDKELTLIDRLMEMGVA